MRRSLTPFARTTAFTLFVLAVLSAAASAPAAVTIFTPGGLDAYFYDLQAEPNRRGAGTDLLNASPTHKNILQLSTLTPTVGGFITPRVDFGTGTEAAPGDGSVLDRGGSGGNVFGGIGLNTLPIDNVAAMWSGKIVVPSDGFYKFTTRSDDGSVMYVGGQKVVDNNFFQGMTNRSSEFLELKAGEHSIVVAGYEGGGGDGFQASWEQQGGFTRRIMDPSELLNDVASPGVFTSGGLRGDYYSVAASEALIRGKSVGTNFPILLSTATPYDIRITPRVDFGVGTEGAPGDGSVLDRGGSDGFPFGGIGVPLQGGGDQDDTIAAIWSGKINVPANGTFRFTTRSDDGSILFIDGVKVVDNNFLQGMTNRSGDIVLTPGLHDILVAGYEEGGGAGFQASWEQIGGFGRQIISPNDLLNDVASPGNFVPGGLKGQYFDIGGTQSLLQGIPANFDNIILETNGAQFHRIVGRVDFGTGTESVPGDGSVLDRGGSDGNPFGGVGVPFFATGDVDDDIAALFLGAILIPESATFQFTTRSDDGNRLWIDINDDGEFDLDELVVDNNFFQGMTNRSGNAFLTAGFHLIKMGFYEGGGGAGVQLSWAQLDGANPFAREIIPTDALFQVAVIEIPEPATAMLGVFGLAALALRRRRTA